jgi:hypothetical protein
MSWVNVAVAGTSILGGMMGAKSAGQQGDLQNLINEGNAKVAEDESMKMAAIIRRAGVRQVGAANAAFAGAGVKVGEGSAAEVERTVMQDYEHDAYQAILEGKRRALGLRTEGKFAQLQGDAQGAALQVNSMSSALGSAYTGMRGTGWRTAGPGFSGTQSPAPIETRITGG